MGEHHHHHHHHHHHIVMLPFMAQGHLIPFLALANKIHRRFGFTITIATTPLNVAYLKTALSSSSSSNQSPPSIHLSSLEFNPSDHGLPPDTENTEALPLAQIINLFHSSAALRPPFQSLIHRISAADGAPPLCIISDVFMGWANEVARSSGTHNIAFTTGGAYGTAAYASIWQYLPHKKNNGTDENGRFKIPGFPDSCSFHVTQMHRFLRAADGNDTWSKFFRPQIAHSLSSFGWLCNTVEEVEPGGLDLLRKFTKSPVWAVGPLIPPAMLSNSRIIGQHTGRVPGASAEKCLQWLDKHPKRSVLYISFGSQNSISASQMMSLALGLEDSKRAFIWVIRPPVGFDSGGEFRPEWLPDGFEERVSVSGLVVHGWAPQLEILCHESTGAFMSHCGWNSTVESLSQGVPMVGWPLAAEQGYNAKMLAEEMGVCVEIARGVDSGISREWVREVVERVMGEGEGEEMRRKAGRVGELMTAGLSEEGSSNRAMDEFVSALLSERGSVAQP